MNPVIWCSITQLSEVVEDLPLSSPILAYAFHGVRTHAFSGTIQQCFLVVEGDIPLRVFRCTGWTEVQHYCEIFRPGLDIFFPPKRFYMFSL